MADLPFQAAALAKDAKVLPVGRRASQQARRRKLSLSYLTRMQDMIASGVQKALAGRSPDQLNRAVDLIKDSLIKRHNADRAFSYLLNLTRAAKRIQRTYRAYVTRRNKLLLAMQNAWKMKIQSGFAVSKQDMPSSPEEEDKIPLWLLLRSKGVDKPAHRHELIWRLYCERRMEFSRQYTLWTKLRKGKLGPLARHSAENVPSKQPVFRTDPRLLFLVPKSSAEQWNTLLSRVQLMEWREFQNNHTLLAETEDFVRNATANLMATQIESGNPPLAKVGSLRLHGGSTAGGASSPRSARKGSGAGAATSPDSGRRGSFGQGQQPTAMLSARKKNSLSPALASPATTSPVSPAPALPYTRWVQEVVGSLDLSGVQATPSYSSPVAALSPKGALKDSSSQIIPTTSTVISLEERRPTFRSRVSIVDPAGTISRTAAASARVAKPLRKLSTARLVSTPRRESLLPVIPTPGTSRSPSFSSARDRPRGEQAPSLRSSNGLSSSEGEANSPLPRRDVAPAEPAQLKDSDSPPTMTIRKGFSFGSNPEGSSAASPTRVGYSSPTRRSSVQGSSPAPEHLLPHLGRATNSSPSIPAMLTKLPPRRMSLGLNDELSSRRRSDGNTARRKASGGETIPPFSRPLVAASSSAAAHPPGR
eukprot:RCo015402